MKSIRRNAHRTRTKLIESERSQRRRVKVKCPNTRLQKRNENEFSTLAIVEAEKSRLSV